MTETRAGEAEGGMEDYVEHNWTKESGHGKELLRDKAASTCPV